MCVLAFTRSEKAVDVVMCCHYTQQASNRAVLVVCAHCITESVQINALLLGAEPFDPVRRRLTHLNTQDFETIVTATVIVVPRDQTH